MSTHFSFTISCTELEKTDNSFLTLDFNFLLYIYWYGAAVMSIFFRNGREEKKLEIEV